MSKKASDPSDFPNPFLFCRERGHHWNHHNDQVTDSTRRLVREVTRSWGCDTCGTTMTEVVSLPDFTIVKRKYDYPDFYLADAPAMGGRMHRADVRREQFTRAGIKF